jgi:hypothetical protein
MIGISRKPREFYALFKCAGLVNAVNATTVLSRCFPGNPEMARYRKPLYDGDEHTYLPDDRKLELTRDELAEVLRAMYTVAERGYI